MFTRNPNRAKAQDDLQPNVEAIAEFLTQCVRLGCDVGPTLVQLTAIDPEDPDAAPRTLSMRPAKPPSGQRKRMELMTYTSLLASPARICGDACERKDVARLRHLFADLDPPASLRQDPATLKAWRDEAVPKIEALLDKHGITAHIVSTGGGLALFAALKQPFEIKTDDDEAYIEDLIPSLCESDSFWRFPTLGKS